MHLSRPLLSSLMLLSVTLFISSLGFGQTTGVITGTVRGDENREFLPFVNVVVKGTGLGAATNDQGRYTIRNVPPGRHTIVASAVGFKPSEVTVNVEAGATTSKDIFLVHAAVQLGEVLVYGASLRKERITEAPAAISLVEAKDIVRLAGSGQLPKLLESEPGVDIVQSGLFDFNINTRGFNSSLNRRLLILVDGRDLATAFLSATEWNGLSVPLEEFGRIELVKGPGSALYGANAFNGVMNVTSTSPRAAVGTHLIVGAGERSALRGDVRHAGVIGQWSYKVNAGYISGKSFSTIRTNRNFEYPGFNPFLNNEVRDLNLDAVRTLYGSARIDYDYARGGIATLEGGIAQTENEVIVTGIGRVQVQKATKPWARLSYTGGGFSVLLWTSGRHNVEPEISLSTGLPLLQNALITHGEVQYNFKAFEDRLFVVAGASHRLVNIDTEGTLMQAKRDDNSSGVFAQVECKVSGALKGIVAARWDRSSLVPSQFSPKAAIVWSPLAEHTLRLTFNQAFQSPNYSELYLYVKHPTSPLAYIGNEKLETEKITGYELGYKGVFQKTLFLTVDAYFNQLKDFVTDLGPALNPRYPFPVILPGEAAPRTIWSYTNAGKVNEAGYDIAVNYYFSDSWLIDANFAYFSFEVVERHPNDILLPNSPKYRINGGLTYTHPKGHDIGIKVKYVPTFPWAAGIYRGDIPAYTLVNLSGRYTFSNSLSLNLNVSNLLDREHYQIFGGSLISRRAILTATMLF
ncbi:MAG: TonB-dependent receptor [Ignavibacteria bacterium]|nr:TonB-dependent receptor [Ignavibacteria bacterium]